MTTDKARAFKADLPLATAALLVVLGGVWLRAQHLAFPKVMSWDEHHFVLNAKNYLAGRPDLNDHPPLGKLLMAVPIHFLGDTSFAWRLAPLVLGCVSIVLVGLLAAWAAERRTAFFIGAALAAMDGFLISYSRCALLDGMLACLCLGAMLVALRSRSFAGMAFAALLLGSACSIKYSAVVFAPLLLWAALSKRAPLVSSLTLALAPLAYAGWYSLGLSLARQPSGLSMVIAETKRLYLHHASLTHWKHPLLSHWYEWYLPTRPLPLRFDTLQDGRQRVLTSLGNPLLWWLVELVLLFTLAAIVIGALVALRRQGLRALASVRRLDSRLVRLAMLFAAWCAPVVPWLVSRRDSYIYHYLLAYVFGITLVATLLDWIERRRRTLGLVLLLVLSQVSLFYAPVWGQLPLSRRGVEARLFLERWR